MATSYPIPCPYCGTVVDSLDSMSDSRAELDFHILSRHPDISIDDQDTLSTHTPRIEDSK